MTDGVVEQVGDRALQLIGIPGTWTGRTRLASIRCSPATGARRPAPPPSRRDRPARDARTPAPRRRPGPAGAGRRPAAAASPSRPGRWRRCPPGPPVSGWARSTSSSARIRARGLRSSWEASATNARCWSAACCNRASIAFIVRARRAISSAVVGSGTRRSSLARRDLVHLGPDGVDRAQRAADGPPDDPGEDGGAGTPMASPRTSAATLSSTSSRLPATSTVSAPAGPASSRAAPAGSSTVRGPELASSGRSGRRCRERRRQRAVGTEDLDDRVVGPQVVDRRRPSGTQGPGHRVGLLGEALVQALREHRPLGQHQARTGDGQHAEHRQRGERGDPCAQGGRSAGHWRGMR